MTTPKRPRRPATLLKKSLWHRGFPLNFAKFLRPPFLTEHLQTTASEQSHMKDKKGFLIT